MTEKKLSNRSRIVLSGIGITGLALVYVFQQVNYFQLFFGQHFSSNAVFIFNKTFRLVINDLLCIILILGLFEKKRFINLAFIIFLIELIIIMPLYLWIKLKMEGDSEISSPFLSQIHRLVVNPMLMFALIAGFYYQKFIANKS